MSQTSYLNKFGTAAGAPWQEGRAPSSRFVTDDHKVIGVMFGHITRTYEDRVSQYLMVSSPAGVVVIRGPGVSDYHEKLAIGSRGPIFTRANSSISAGNGNSASRQIRNASANF